jgi:lipopolysaccharide export LptBFGC system permease protein LptF
MVNCGVLLFLAVVLGKFFNEDFSFTIKGVVFIVCGLLFFLVNTIFARKIKQEVRS